MHRGGSRSPVAPPFDRLRVTSSRVRLGLREIRVGAVPLSAVPLSVVAREDLFHRQRGRRRADARTDFDLEAVGLDRERFFDP